MKNKFDSPVIYRFRIKDQRRAPRDKVQCPLFFSSEQTLSPMDRARICADSAPLANPGASRATRLLKRRAFIEQGAEGGELEAGFARKRATVSNLAPPRYTEYVTHFLCRYAVAVSR
jgi:hypothetical protein